MRFFTSAGMPLAVLAMGLATTAVAVRALSDSGSQRDQQRFDRTANELASALKQRLAEETRLQAAAAKLIASCDGQDKAAELSKFLDAFRPQDRGGTRLMGYTRRLLPHELPKLEAEHHRNGNLEFTIHPDTVKRPEHFVVTITYPSIRQWQWWSGLDLSAEVNYRQAIERARESGAAVATPCTMASSPERRPSQPIFCLFTPVYKQSNPPTTAPSPRPQFVGAVFTSYRVTDLLTAMFQPGNVGDVGWSVQDAAPGADGGLPLFRSTTLDAVAAAPSFSADLPVAVAGRSWTLSVRAGPAFRDVAAAEQVRNLAMIGALASLLAAGLVALHGRLRASVVRRANQSEWVLREASVAQQRLEMVLDVLGAGMWSCDLPDGRVKWDDRARGMYFLDGATDVTVTQALERVHPEDRGRLRDGMAAAVAASAPFDISYRTVSADGGKVHSLRSIGRPERIDRKSADRPAPTAFSGVTVDITARETAWQEAERARLQAEDARADAEHAVRAKDELLATIGHELRAPLSAILGWAQLLRRQPDRLNPAVDDGLAVIERNARAQDRLVADLLDVSLVASGTMRMTMELVDLAAAARSAVETIRPSAESKQVDLQLTLDLTAGPVRGDPGRLQQVVANLLTNAVKFTPAGGRIKVRVAREGDRVVLTVADTGEGIDPEFLPHVFDRFRQQDASTARRHGGLGLGLAIVRHLVELHDGTVRAESPGVGLGATFTVELPAACPATPGGTRRGRDRLGRSEDAAAAPADALSPDALQNIKVLLVDDDPDALAAAAGVLSAAGARVTLARNAPEGLASVMRDRPTVVLCDIGMPEVDGYEFLRRLRALSPDSGGAVPAAALTGFARPEDSLRTLAGGFQAHIAKPADADELVLTVLRLSQLDRSRAMTGAEQKSA